ncbi:MAG: YicC family protein [Flavobacteriaceae bacterium]|nr:YicC family protein [Flavobacteriaceae bacterium]
MIQSMTGYGKSTIQLPTKKISIELKSLNSKNLDLNARMPSMYREKELTIRKFVASNLTRGKIDFSLYMEMTGEETSAQINEGVLKKYMNQLKNIVHANDTELLKMAIKMPDALKTEREEIDEKEWQLIDKEIKNTVIKIQKYRKEEGSALEKDFLFRIQNIATLLSQVMDVDPDRIENVRLRLEKSVNELKERVDENRFEQELIYYIEKYDITEEKVRLENHIDYFTKSLNSKDSNGKKLGFISQEIGREINTIGSKANYAPMQKLVVQMKDELEKIKEQLLNVL